MVDGTLQHYRALAKLAASLILATAAYPCMAQIHSIKNGPGIRVSTPTEPLAQKASPTMAAAIAKSYGSMPLSLEANRGQADARVKFLARGSGYNLFVTETEAVVSLAGPSRNDIRDTARLHTNALRIKLVGANPSAKITALEELPGRSNYFIGNDPAKWRTGVVNYAKLRIEEVYPGIDLVYYGNQRRLEYDWILAPGVDPALIRFEIAGAHHTQIDASGDLVVKLHGEEIKLRRPLTYQEQTAGRVEVATKYAMTGKNQFGFGIDPFDRSLPLVIDPVLIYSTYLGGDGDDTGIGIALDSSGNAYVVGKTRSGNFPTANSIPGMPGGFGSYAFVTKLNAAGDRLIYSTYLGGSGNNSGEAIAVDSDGFAYVAGSTYSSDFPTKNPLQAMTGGGGYDAFVAKLNASGDGLEYSTYLGGNNGDAAYGIAVDSAQNAYVTGRTFSTNFPIANPYQAKSGGRGDAFVTKLSRSGTALVYSTYLGGNGSGDDWGWGIAVDASGNAYITGQTYSNDFPIANLFRQLMQEAWMPSSQG
jgi:hypothetical protein